MEKHCYCPKSFNVAVGIFMVFLAILAFLKIWEIYMPLWLSISTLIIGSLLIFLNSINPIPEKVTDDTLGAEKANQLDIGESY